jgi:hypothetical protein
VVVEPGGVAPTVPGLAAAGGCFARRVQVESAFGSTYTPPASESVTTTFFTLAESKVTLIVRPRT